MVCWDLASGLIYPPFAEFTTKEMKLKEQIIEGNFHIIFEIVKYILTVNISRIKTNNS